MDKKELMAEYNRAVLFGEIYDSKPATQKGQVAVRIGRGKNAGKFFIRGGKSGGAAKPEAKKSSRVVGQTKDGRNIFKKSRKPSGIREKRRLAKENANEGIGELKTETNFNKRGKLINSFSMDKINDIIGHMKLQNHGSKTDKVDRILMAIDKKLPAEHRYFE